MSSELYDIIIVGGGPVGLAQALALTRFQRGLRVALVDRRPFTVPDDKRAFALSAGVRRVLDTLGVWDELAAEAQPVRAMKITDSGLATSPVRPSSPSKATSPRASPTRT